MPARTAIGIDGQRLQTDREPSFSTAAPDKTNKVRIGGGTLRYAKGKALPTPVGVWQSAILLGMLAKTNANEDAEPEGKLCITIDAYTGGRHLAPTNAVTRFKEAEAACATIAQLWPTIKPPDGAVL